MAQGRAFGALGALILGIGFLLAGCAGTSAPCDTVVQPAAAVTRYQLGSGDLVRVNVYREPDLSGEFRVDGKGHLALPLAGDISVGQLTTREVEQAIAARLREGDYLRNPQVSIQVLTYRPFYILGEVRKPGEYAYQNGMTAINAVAVAGGYTHRAKASGVTIERGVCIVEGLPDTPVVPGDVIKVPERFF